MGQESVRWGEPLPGVWSVVPFTIRLRGRSSVVPSGQGVVLLLETNSKANRKSSSNSKNRLTGKVLSCNGRERNFRE